jgi:hypothetical protein
VQLGGGKQAILAVVEAEMKRVVLVSESIYRDASIKEALASFTTATRASYYRRKYRALKILGY